MRPKVYNGIIYNIYKNIEIYWPCHKLTQLIIKCTAINSQVEHTVIQLLGSFVR